MNRLADENSPYLQQHKDNPVDWYPWGEEAFARAKAEDRPILLSVGYAACHWCHVMAHESFEDPEVAEVMNGLFVNVKVDREERPDVDAVYMEAVQAMSGHGGWPMTVFLTPDGQPFYGGTYYPKTPRGGMPGFVNVLQGVAQAWEERREDVLSSAGHITEMLQGSGQLAAAADAGLPTAEVVDQAAAQLVARLDAAWGGFGPAPKFPQPDLLEVLLRSLLRTGSDESRKALTLTLDAMAAGGIYDHVGGGFHRYSVDREWLVPHFEKMLYDEALLARAYLHTWQVTGEERYLQVASETIDYVRRDLRQEGGGFSSSEDADSEGVEGKFYVWSLDEVRGVSPAAVEWWGVTAQGNFEGHTILRRPLGAELARPPEVEEARQALLEIRAKRVRPGLDDKVLTEWNGLFLATLAEAAAATGRTDWLDDARTNGEFLLASLRRDDGRWLRSWQGGNAKHLAYAADYAAMVNAFVRLAEATGEARWVAEARATADAMLDLFWDDAAGGLFTNGHDAERLITRAKDVIDNVIPSANGAAAVALVRLAALTGEERYHERAEDIIRLVADPLGRHPTAFAHLVAAVEMIHAPMTEVAVVGERPDLVRAVHERYLPNAVLAWGEPYPSPLFESRDPGFAYVCQHFTCKIPTDDVSELKTQLGG
jgi:uncharacterized protein YyaL (SSP411 family)